MACKQTRHRRREQRGRPACRHTALLAIYTDGFAKAGTILAKNSSTGRYVPFDNAGSNGTNTAVGILYTTVKVTNRAGTAINSPFSMLRHGQV